MEGKAKLKPRIPVKHCAVRCHVYNNLVVGGGQSTWDNKNGEGKKKKMNEQTRG